MSWPRFVVFNAAGGILWASCYGLAAYYFGIEMLTRPIGLTLLVAAIIFFVGSVWFVHRHEAELAAKAEGAFPGPVKRRKSRRSGA